MLFGFDVETADPSAQKSGLVMTPIGKLTKMRCCFEERHVPALGRVYE
jgi:hypothetical protein